jgi:hypothetical protein
VAAVGDWAGRSTLRKTATIATRARDGFLMA